MAVIVVLLIATLIQMLRNLEALLEEKKKQVGAEKVELIPGNNI